MQNNNLVYADFGNTRAKFLLQDKELIILDYNSSFQSSLKKLLRNNTTLVYSSVNINAENIIREFLPPKFRKNASQILKKQTLIDYSNISGMGSDRLLGIIGGLSFTIPPLMTIDCGTAVTINVLDKNNEVLGGMILPGINLQEKALRENTSGLKKWEFKSSAVLIGTNTSEAISSGIINGIGFSVSGAVKAIINKYFPEEKVSIFLTGGSSELIKPVLDPSFQVIHKPSLVLDGLKFLYKNI